MRTKTCRTCNETKIITDFTKNVYARDGYLNRCKICTNKYYKERKGVGGKDEKTFVAEFSILDRAETKATQIYNDMVEWHLRAKESYTEDRNVQKEVDEFLNIPAKEHIEQIMKGLKGLK